MLIDSHCHLIDEKYDIDIPQVIKEARDVGVGKIITVGTSLEENDNTLRLLDEHKNVYGSLGIYPHEELGKDPAELIPALKEQLLSSEKVVAVGETGIDITEHPNQRSLDGQLELLDMQLGIAAEIGKPVVIHNRNGDEQVIKAIKPHTPKLSGVFHCFTQDMEFAKKVLDLGFYISFTGIITYPKNNVLREVVKMVPLERVMVETDAPWLPPQGYRGQINYPKYVKIVAEKIAQVKQEPYEKVEEVLYENTCAFFDI